MGVAALGAAALILLLAVKLVGDDDNGDSAEGPVALSEGELVARAGELDPAAYWVGPQPETSDYELDTSVKDRTYIRYLTEGAATGDPAANYLTVGTYSVPNALTRIREGKTPGGKLSRESGYAVLEDVNGLSAYVVLDEQPDIHIEIFHPEPGRAVRFARSGELRPLG